MRERSSPMSWTRARLYNDRILPMTSSHRIWTWTEAGLSILHPVTWFLGNANTRGKTVRVMHASISSATILGHGILVATPASRITNLSSKPFNLTPLSPLPSSSHPVPRNLHQWPCSPLERYAGTASPASSQPLPTCLRLPSNPHGLPQWYLQRVLLAQVAPLASASPSSLILSRSASSLSHLQTFSSVFRFGLRSHSSGLSAF